MNVHQRVSCLSSFFFLFSSECISEMKKDRTWAVSKASSFFLAPSSVQKYPGSFHSKRLLAEAAVTAVERNKSSASINKQKLNKALLACKTLTPVLSLKLHRDALGLIAVQFSICLSLCVCVGGRDGITWYNLSAICDQIPKNHCPGNQSWSNLNNLLWKSCSSVDITATVVLICTPVVFFNGRKRLIWQRLSFTKPDDTRAISTSCPLTDGRRHVAAQGAERRPASIHRVTWVVSPAS